MVALPCGSLSISSTLRCVAASDAARLTAVVVLPTPPFWLATAMTRFIRAPSLPDPVVRPAQFDQVALLGEARNRERVHGGDVPPLERGREFLFRIAAFHAQQSAAA